MDDARRAAEDLSEGINWIATIVALLQTDDCLPSERNPVLPLEGMERALDAIRAKRVNTSIAVTEELLDQVRQTRLAISQWQQTGDPPSGLLGTATSILKAFGVIPTPPT
jgi:hypothetical protein